MQHIGTVRIEHALGVARGAGSIAKPSRGFFIEARPGEITIGLRQPINGAKNTI